VSGTPLARDHEVFRRASVRPVDLMPWIAAERRDVADLIDSLTPDQLATPSLCDAWTVHDVAAHLLMPLVTPMPRVLLAMARSGFDFDRANLRLTAQVARRPAAELATGLRERAATPFHPPGRGFEAPLNDVLVHRQDMCRPLGLVVRPADDRLRVALDATARLRTDGDRARPRFAGLGFRATDLDCSFGPGTRVAGPATALLLVLNGRDVALPEVTGPGADLLRERSRG